MNNYTFDTRAAVIEEIANWYSEKGWRMDEEDVADAIRALATAPSPASLPVAPEAAMLVKELNRISMSLAADLVQGTDYTFHGYDYLDRNFVCERVMQWRAEWDATAPARNALVEAAYAAVAPSELTKSQERDYNWLLGLAKSKGYQTVYGALYAAPTTVPDLGILPSHSEREAANAGGLPVDLIHDFRDAINIAHHRADHAGDTTRMKRWKEVSRRLEAYVRTINAPATIAAGQEAANAKDAALANRVRDLIADHVADNWPMVRYHLEEVERKLRAINADYLLEQDRAAMAPVGAAGQEAANAKDAARPIPDAECAQGSCARGKDGCRGRCCLAGHKLPIVADIDSAAMAAVGAAGQEGGDK